MAAHEIPLSPEAQAFSVALSGVGYNMRIYFADAPSGGWMLDISDAAGVALAHGLALVPGVNLVSSFGYLGITGSLVLINDASPGNAVGYSELGVSSRLIWIDPE